MKYNSRIQGSLKLLEESVSALNETIYEEQLFCNHLRVAKVNGLENCSRVCLDCGLSEKREGTGYLILDQDFMAEISSGDYHTFNSGFRLHRDNKTEILRSAKDDRLSVLRRQISKRHTDTKKTT